MMSSGNAKIRPRKLKTGERVYGLQIVKNLRLNGQPTYKVLKALGSVHENDIPRVSGSWWAETDKGIDELVASRVLMQNCAAKIRKQLEAVIPRPSALPVPTPSNKETILAALAERGIHL